MTGMPPFAEIKIGHMLIGARPVASPLKRMKLLAEQYSIEDTLLILSRTTNAGLWQH